MDHKITVGANGLLAYNPPNNHRIHRRHSNLRIPPEEPHRDPIEFPQPVRAP